MNDLPSGEGQQREISANTSYDSQSRAVNERSWVTSFRP